MDGGVSPGEQIPQCCCSSPESLGYVLANPGRRNLWPLSAMKKLISVWFETFMLMFPLENVREHSCVYLPSTGEKKDSAK